MISESVLVREAVQTNICVQDKRELFSQLAKPLLDYQFVKEEYIEKVLEREINYPTGLQTKSIGVAIPHTDPIYVNQNSLSIGVLKEPINFQLMSTPEESVDVVVVFLLALNDGKKHLTFLKKVISFIQNEKALDQIMHGDQEQVYQLIADHFNE